MKHLKKFNESKNINEMPLLVRRNIPVIINQSISNGVNLEDLLSVIRDEWNKSTMPKEKPTFTTLSSEEKEQMMKDAIKMSEDQWMKKYQVGDHGDYLRMAKSKWLLD